MRSTKRFLTVLTKRMASYVRRSHISEGMQALSHPSLLLRLYPSAECKDGLRCLAQTRLCAKGSAEMEKIMAEHNVSILGFGDNVVDQYDHIRQRNDANPAAEIYHFNLSSFSYLINIPQHPYTFSYQADVFSYPEALCGMQPTSHKIPSDRNIHSRLHQLHQFQAPLHRSLHISSHIS